jgi:OOP family OmpA-OmpF porin
VKLRGDTLQMPGNLVFASGSATLEAGAANEEILAQLKNFLEANQAITLLRIEGHTDNVGKPEDNLQLSGQRALSIKKWLVDHGVPSLRLVAVGFGASRPIADNGTEEGRAQNRRTQFKVAERNGKRYRDPLAGGTEFK